MSGLIEGVRFPIAHKIIPVFPKIQQDSLFMIRVTHAVAFPFEQTYRQIGLKRNYLLLLYV